MGALIDPVQVFRRYVGDLQAIALRDELRDAGWHLVSSVELTDFDDPPVPDKHVMDTVRYGAPSPLRLFQAQVMVDREILTYRHAVDRVFLLRSEVPFERYARDRLRYELGQAIYDKLTKETKNDRSDSGDTPAA